VVLILNAIVFETRRTQRATKIFTKPSLLKLGTRGFEGQWFAMCQAAAGWRFFTAKTAKLAKTIAKNIALLTRTRVE
jgi:hypothetical protein